MFPCVQDFFSKTSCMYPLIWYSIVFAYEWLMWENVVFQVVRSLTVCGTSVCAWAIVTTTFMVVKSVSWSNCMQCYDILYDRLIIQTKIAIFQKLNQNMEITSAKFWTLISLFLKDTCNCNCFVRLLSFWLCSGI